MVDPPIHHLWPLRFPFCPEDGGQQRRPGSVRGRPQDEGWWQSGVRVFSCRVRGRGRYEGRGRGGWPRPPSGQRGGGTFTHLNGGAAGVTFFFGVAQSSRLNALHPPGKIRQNGLLKVLLALCKCAKHTLAQIPKRSADASARADHFEDGFEQLREDFHL